VPVEVDERSTAARRWRISLPAFVFFGAHAYTTLARG
jgi:hypothetical protein